MKTFKILLIILVFGIITGCSWFRAKPDPDIQYKTKIVLVTPPDELLVKCTVLPPPAKDTYIKNSWEEKEKQLVNYSLSLITEIKKCNLTFDNVIDWKKRQIQIYPTESNP